MFFILDNQNCMWCFFNVLCLCIHIHTILHAVIIFSDSMLVHSEQVSLFGILKGQSSDSRK